MEEEDLDMEEKDIKNSIKTLLSLLVVFGIALWLFSIIVKPIFNRGSSGEKEAVIESPRKRIEVEGERKASEEQEDKLPIRQNDQSAERANLVERPRDETTQKEAGLKDREKVDEEEVKDTPLPSSLIFSHNEPLPGKEESKEVAKGEKTTEKEANTLHDPFAEMDSKALMKELGVGDSTDKPQEEKTEEWLSPEERREVIKKRNEISRILRGNYGNR